MRLALPLLVAALALACGEDVAPTAPDAASGLVLRPGDSLLDLADAGRLLQRPDSNAPPDVAALRGGPIRLRSPEVSPGSWTRVANVPSAYQPLLDMTDGLALWRTAVPLELLADADPPAVLIEGVPLPHWNPAAQPAPDFYAWCDGGLDVLLALSREPPRGVAIEGWVDGEEEFHPYERAGGADVETVRRYQLGDQTRPGRLLPAPGRLAIDVDRLQADRLDLAFGVMARAWTVWKGVVHRDRDKSDGVTFAVEVELHEEGGDAGPDAAAGPRTERVWSRHVAGTEVGVQWHEATVYLTRFRGRAVTLHLVTDPGPDGSTASDYAVWADLRLRGGEARAPSRPHVVIVDVDTLRADRLGAGAGLTPRLDDWARRSAVTYTDAVSTAGWTLPATVTMLTGLDVHQHGVDRATDALGRDAMTLARVLRASGYETRAVAAGGYMLPTFGFDAGFDVFETRDPKDVDWSDVLDFVRSRDGERPVFLFLHTYLVHAPYPYEREHSDPAYDGAFAGVEVDYGNLIDPFHAGELELSLGDRRYVEDMYDALVRRMDATIGGFIEELDALLDGEPLLLVLTSDHGEAFFEHGDLAHGRNLYHELLSVPLVIQYPDGRSGRVDAPVSLLDVVPTVLDVVGLNVPEELPGVSLAPGPPPERVRVAAHRDTLRSVQSGSYKLIETLEPDRAAELFRLDDDPLEQRDLSDETPATVAELRRRLDAYVNAHPAPDLGAAAESDMGVDDVERLRALGYLGDG